MVGNQLQIELGDARIVGPNRLPLYTQFFNSPVTRIEIKRAKQRRTLEISLRAPVQPSISSEQAASGYHFLYLDFPAGDYLPKPAPVAHREAPPPPPKIEGAGLEEGQIEGAANGRAQGSARSRAKLDSSMDRELPPGMAKPKAKATTKSTTKASGSFKIGR